MRTRIAVAILATAVTTGAALLATTAAADATTGTAATKQIVVRPVTSSGYAAHGFHVKKSNAKLDCSFANPSPAAVSKNILECSPSAAYAVACWKAAQHKRTLCLDNPAQPKLVKFGYAGRFAKTAPPKQHRTAPLRLVLANGAVCSIRDGGAWGQLRKHPHWFATYGCNGTHSDEAVWAPAHARHMGIDESSSSWTVKVAGQTGNQKVYTRRVVKAYFVGTAG